MKAVIVMFLTAVAALGQQVVITVKVDGSTVEATLSPDAVAAMVSFVADQKLPSGAPKYANITDLMVRHFMESLAGPLVKRYSSTAAAAKADVDKAKADADAAVAAAAAGTIVVK